MEEFIIFILLIYNDPNRATQKERIQIQIHDTVKPSSRRCLSSWHLKMKTEGAEMQDSGKEFQLAITRLEKKIFSFQAGRN